LVKQSGAIPHKQLEMLSDVDRELQLESLYAAHSAAIFAYALRRSSWETACDVVAETFVVAWRRLDDLADDNALPWLYTIARKVLSSHRRSTEQQRAIADRLAAQPVFAPLEPSEQTRDVLEALAALAPADREILMLIAWEELSSVEAASVIGCSATAARIRLHRARKHLRAVLAESERGQLPQLTPNTEGDSRC
jgi:RNA polymerase sigma-70 factor, ECF subfamily